MQFVLDFPYTISFCIKKSQQIESFFELPKDKRPPEDIWDDSEELEIWLDNIFSNKPNSLEIELNDIEG